MILKIRQLGDMELREICREVDLSDGVPEEVERLVKNMEETMRAKRGIGLSANQVGWTLRVVVIGLDETIVMINPVITKSAGVQVSMEGCLSVSNGTRHERVARAKRITVEYNDHNGLHIRRKCSHLMAACVQHEIDHLDGKLFIDDRS